MASWIALESRLTSRDASPSAVVASLTLSIRDAPECIDAIILWIDACNSAYGLKRSESGQRDCWICVGENYSIGRCKITKWNLVAWLQRCYVWRAAIEPGRQSVSACHCHVEKSTSVYSLPVVSPFNGLLPFCLPFSDEPLCIVRAASCRFWPLRLCISILWSSHSRPCSRKTATRHSLRYKPIRWPFLHGLDRWRPEKICKIHLEPRIRSVQDVKDPAVLEVQFWATHFSPVYENEADLKLSRVMSRSTTTIVPPPPSPPPLPAPANGDWSMIRSTGSFYRRNKSEKALAALPGGFQMPKAQSNIFWSQIGWNGSINSEGQGGVRGRGRSGKGDIGASSWCIGMSYCYVRSWQKP